MNGDHKKRRLAYNKLFSMLAIAALLCWSNSAMANRTVSGHSHDVNGQMQTQAITGVVVDEAGEAVIGASILEKGTKNGTITDFSGRFSLNANPGATLVITYIGYQPQEVRATGSMRIVMKEDSKVLDEVVVVGYGSMKRENLTGAVATVDVGKTLESRPIADVGRGLQGTTPGLSVVIGSGEVGVDPTIRIRGQYTSMEGSAAPLILLDNVEIPSISLVNPDDIESISILKDAASASIYGAKAAFGVVLITTKKGAKQDRVNVNYSANFSWQNMSKKYEMGGVDAMEYSVLANLNGGGSGTVGAFFIMTPEQIKLAREWEAKYGGKIGKNDPTVYGRDWIVSPVNSAQKWGLRTYDPYDYMIKEWAPTQSHNLSVSGKSGKTTFNIGLGYLDQSGMNKPAKKDKFERYNASVRLSTEYNKYVTFNAGALYSSYGKYYPFTTTGQFDPWYYLYRWGPQYPFGVDEHGRDIRSPESEYKQANTAERKTNYTSINIGARLNLTKNWTADFDYTHSNNEFTRLLPGMRFHGGNFWEKGEPRLDENGNAIMVPGPDGSMIPAYDLSYQTHTGVGTAMDAINREAWNTRQNTINAYTTYNLNLTKDHIFKFMLGMNRVTYDYEGNWSERRGITDFSNPQFNMASGAQTSGGDKTWQSQLGYYGRINYAFMDKYLIEGNVRYDGSSKFPTGLKWRWFPSFSVGWRASEEVFMQWAKPVLSSLKFRGSYGMIGDQTVSNSLYIATLGSGQLGWLDESGNKVMYTSAPTAIASDITWQDIETLDLGVDFRLFDNKLGFTFDWYQRDTKNMIVPAMGVPHTYGIAAPKGNYGHLKTRGWELAVDYNHRFNNGLSVNAMFTLSDAITKIEEYGTTKSLDSWYAGKTYGEIWGYRTDRLYQKDDFEYDANGKLILITLDATHGSKNAGKKAYKLKGENPVYQAYLQSGSFYFGPGDVKFKDLDGDGQITDGIETVNTIDDHGDLVKIGNTTPRFEYGFRIGADYKGFDFAIFFQGVGKRDLWGSSGLTLPGFNAADGAIAKTFSTNYWTEENVNAFYPRPYNQANEVNINNMKRQDRYLLDMSYLRLKNVNLGYTLPAVLTKKAWVQKARVYVSLENFYTWDNLNGLPVDPEEIPGRSLLATDGDNYGAARAGIGTPTFKSFSVGVQLNF